MSRLRFMADMPVCDRRLAAAVVLVVAIVLAVPLSDVLVHGATRMAPSTGVRGIDAASLLREENGEKALGKVEALLAEAGKSAEMPAWFREEVGLPPGARDVRIVGSGDVVGYSADCGAQEALDALCAHMGQRGWKVVPLGGITGSTFVKGGGTCSWVLATCTQTGTSTSVVLNCKVG